MPFVVVLCLVLLFVAALSRTWFRPVGGPWYDLTFYWGVFFLAVYLTWPTLKALGL